MCGIQVEHSDAESVLQQNFSNDLTESTCPSCDDCNGCWCCLCFIHGYAVLFLVHLGFIRPQVTALGRSPILQTLKRVDGPAGPPPMTKRTRLQTTQGAFALVCRWTDRRLFPSVEERPQYAHPSPNPPLSLK